VAVACVSLDRPTTPTTPTTTATTAPKSSAPASFPLRVLLSADEHGWLSPLLDKNAGVLRGGIHAAAGAMRAEGYTKDGPGWLLLSAGDMWTGPFETTVLEGAPMTAAMGHLGYRAAAVGNHEFDFGQHALARQASAASFPFLGANLVETGSGRQPAWVKAWTMVELPVPGGIARIAVVGLACVESPVTADVRHMSGLAFQPYDETLRRILPEVKAAHPDAIVVVAHDRIDAVKPLVSLLREHGVHLVAAGHEHRPGIVVDDAGTEAVGDDVVICNAGPFLRTLCRVDLDFSGGVLTAHAEKIVAVEHARDAPAPPFDDDLARIVAEAEASADRVGGEILVENKQKLTRGLDGTLGQLLVDAWLEALPFAQVAITNAGGLRQDIEPGPLRLRDIVSALPFNNTLVVVDVTGRELREVLLANPESVVGGLRYEWSEDAYGGRTVHRVVDRTGAEIGDDRQLKVVINDFMYRGGDHYTFLDRTPEETAVDWREPVYRLLRRMREGGVVLDRRADDRAIRR
jgi:2',3'-cyclic-nucleotide 2'-phosphodiesterase (5'-nucleotidase family)